MTLDEAKQEVAKLPEDEARRRLAWVWNAAEDAASAASTDNADPPHQIDEILAHARGESCDECGDYRRDWRFPRQHYTHCSKYGQRL